MAARFESGPEGGMAFRVAISRKQRQNCPFSVPVPELPGFSMTLQVEPRPAWVPKTGEVAPIRQRPLGPRDCQGKLQRLGGSLFALFEGRASKNVLEFRGSASLQSDILTSTKTGHTLPNFPVLFRQPAF